MSFLLTVTELVSQIYATVKHSSGIKLVYKTFQSKTKEETAADEEEIDKLLESFNKLDTVCNGDKCKTAVSVLGVNCNFCRLRLAHHVFSY